MPAFAGEIANPAQYNIDTKRLVGLAGPRTTSSTATTTEQDVLGMDGVQLLGGHAYKIWTTPLFGDTTSANIPAAQVRYSTTGTASTAATSTVLPGSRCDLRQADGAFQESMSVQTLYLPSADEVVSFVLTCVAATGSSTTLEASATRIIMLVVEHMGLNPGNTGINL